MLGNPSFEDLVKQAVSRVPLQTCRKYSGRARRYMLAYHYYVLNGNKAVEGYEIIEKLMKKVYTSHRDAHGFDGNFIADAMKQSFDIPT